MIGSVVIAAAGGQFDRQQYVLAGCQGLHEVVILLDSGHDATAQAPPPAAVEFGHGHPRGDDPAAIGAVAARHRPEKRRLPAT